MDQHWMTRRRGNSRIGVVFLGLGSGLPTQTTTSAFSESLYRVITGAPPGEGYAVA